MPMMINKQYLLLGESLSGGMAEIYKAVDSKNDGKLGLELSKCAKSAFFVGLCQYFFVIFGIYPGI